MNPTITCATLALTLCHWIPVSAGQTVHPASKPGTPEDARPPLFLAYNRIDTEDVEPAGDESAIEVPAEEGMAAEDYPGIWFSRRPPLDAAGSMASDRPGFSDTYAVVTRGYSHLEFGYSFYYDREGPSRTQNHLLGEFSWRTGLVDNFELRLKWAGFSFTESLYEDTSRWAGRRIHVTDHNDGGTDMGLGFKTQLLKQNGLVPNLSIIPAISLPTGAGGKSTGDVDPEVRLAWNYALSDKWSVYGVGLATWLTDGRDDRFFQAGASLASYYQFTDNLGGFVEYYGLYPSTRESDCQHNIDFGPVILVNDNFQIDIRAGFGLNEEAPDFQAGIGFCCRF